MIHSHRWFVALIFAVLLLSGYAQAQQSPATPQPSPTPDDTETKAMREKAFKVLESVAAQINTLHSAENRARMGSNLVDSFWEKDEERARALLRMVQEDITTELQKREPGTQANNAFIVFYRLRQDTIERVAKHDGEAALEFFKVTQPVWDEQAPYELRENERALELKLAEQVAANNPEVALKIGRQSLERDYSYELLSVLRKLNRKHREQALVLYKEIVEKLHNGKFKEDWGHRYFAQALVQAFPPPAADESTYRELIGLFVTTALEQGCANKLSEEDEGTEYCRWLAGNIPDLEKFDARAARLRHWRTGDHRYAEYSLVYREMEELLQEDALDDLETLIAKNPELAEQIRLRIFNRAQAHGDPEEIRKIVARFFPDPRRQAQLLAEAQLSEKGPEINDKRLASIRTQLEEIPHAYGKASFLLSQVQQIRPANRKIALQLLADASDIVETMKPGKQQTEARLGLAMMYCLQKSDRCFTIMEAMVPKLNELVEMAAKLDGYDTDYLREGEWNMSANGSVGSILTVLSQQAGYFAWADFDRAVNLANQFERPEIRMMAHLKLAQSVLFDTQKRPTRVFTGQ